VRRRGTSPCAASGNPTDGAALLGRVITCEGKGGFVASLEKMLADWESASSLSTRSWHLSSEGREGMVVRKVICMSLLCGLMAPLSAVAQIVIDADRTITNADADDLTAGFTVN